MDYFETYATEIQKFNFEQSIRKHTKFDMLDTESDRQIILNSVIKLRRLAGAFPKSIYITDYDVTYNVYKCEMIKVNGVNHYKLEIKALPDKNIISNNASDIENLCVTVDSMTKEKYFGTCRQVILSSTIHGLVGLAISKYQPNYLEIVPDIFKDLLTLHSDEEIVDLYIDNLVNNAEEFLNSEAFANNNDKENLK